MYRKYFDRTSIRKITKLMNRYQSLVRSIETGGITDENLLKELHSLETDSKKIVAVVQNDIEMRAGQRQYNKGEVPLSAVCIQRFVFKLRYVRRSYRKAMTDEMYKKFYDEVKYISRHCFEMIDQYITVDETIYGTSPTVAASNT